MTQSNRMHQKPTALSIALSVAMIPLMIPVASALTQPPAEAPVLDELDILSQRKDDPFGEITIEKQRQPVSVTLRALDKVIARTIDIEINMNEVADFGTLEIVPRFCDKRPPEDFPETSAFLEIFDKRLAEQEREDARAAATGNDSGNGVANPSEVTSVSETTTETTPAPQPQPLSATTPPTILAEPVIGPDTEGARVFSGWMFASSPGLNALEHAVYDVWVIDCKTQLVENSEE